MFKKLWLLFILTTFITGVFGESVAVPSGHESEIQSSVEAPQVGAAALSSLDTDCEDCEDKDCHSSAAHCMHHCSGLHNIVVSTVNVLLSNSFRINSKISRSYSFHYQEPSLDPALKPPLHS